MQVIEGKLNASGKKFGIVAGRFNDFITSKLVEGALDCIIRHEGSKEDITLTWVPGSYEIPLTALQMAETNKFDAIVTLGAVIRGSTSHYDLVASEVAKGVANASMQTRVPIIFGVLTTDTIEQAVERAGTKAGNKGWESALGAIEMAEVMDKLKNNN
jgi:6,7-dimethyl-8-ribityllumazine synthase